MGQEQEAAEALGMADSVCPVRAGSSRALSEGHGHLQFLSVFMVAAPTAIVLLLLS